MLTCHEECVASGGKGQAAGLGPRGGEAAGAVLVALVPGATEALCSGGKPGRTTLTERHGAGMRRGGARPARAAAQGCCRVLPIVWESRNAAERPSESSKILISNLICRCQKVPKRRKENRVVERARLGVPTTSPARAGSTLRAATQQHRRPTALRPVLRRHPKPAHPPPLPRCRTARSGAVPPWRCTRAARSCGCWDVRSRASVGADHVRIRWCCGRLVAHVALRASPHMLHMRTRQDTAGPPVQGHVPRRVEQLAGA